MFPTDRRIERTKLGRIVCGGQSLRGKTLDFWIHGDFLLRLHSVLPGGSLTLPQVDEDPEDPEHFRLESLEPKLSLKQSHSLLLMAASHGEHFPAAFQLLTGYRGSDVILRTHFQHLIQAIVK